MSARGERRCLACGGTRQVEEHHVAARGNDRELVRDLCERCHRELTAWQWRLGIVHRGTGRGDAPEPTALRRAWALVEGTVLLGLVLDPGGTAAAAHALGRAAGAAARMADDFDPAERPLGPSPAWGRREAQDARPAPRGSGDAAALLDLALEAAARLDPDAGLEDLRGRLPRAHAWLRQLEAESSGRVDLGARVARLERALAEIAAAPSLEALVAHPEALRALADAARTTVDLLRALGDVATIEEARAAAAEALG